jgi:hypothetical protein
MRDIDGDGRAEAIIGNRMYRLGDPGIESIDDDIELRVMEWRDGFLVDRGDGPLKWKQLAPVLGEG